MRVPGIEQADIPRAKIVDYLLSAVHPTGRTKARWFVQFGFDAEHWEILRDALKDHETNHDVVRTEESQFGRRYVVEGDMESPDGRTPRIRGVWFVKSGESVSRFVTAYPLRRRER